MHRLVMGLALESNRNIIVDHINHLTYDNRKENLRICTQSDNVANSTLMSSPTVGIKKGKNNKWIARITRGNKYFHLGTGLNCRISYLPIKKRLVKIKKKGMIYYEM